jgi:hypothetical protein
VGPGQGNAPAVNTATWPLVGRVAERTQVVAAMDGGAGGVLFAAPPGWARPVSPSNA